MRIAVVLTVSILPKDPVYRYYLPLTAAVVGVELLVGVAMLLVSAVSP